MPTGTLYITGDAEADGLLNTDGTALLIGMLLDQQVPMEWAFAGPATLRARLGHLDARKIAALDQEEFVTICATKPAIHRFPASMGRRIHDVCVVLTEQYDGKAERIWTDVASGAELYERLHALPGYGVEKSTDLRGDPRQADGRHARGLARGGRQVRRRHSTFGRRHRRRGDAREGAGMEEGPEGGEAGQAGPPGAHLTSDPTAPPDPVLPDPVLLGATLPDDGDPPVPVSEGTDVRAVRSSHDRAAAARRT